MPQAPQWAPSLARFAHVLPQSVPLVQPQAPFEHACPDGQAWPQLPQLAEFCERSTHWVPHCVVVPVQPEPDPPVAAPPVPTSPPAPGTPPVAVAPPVLAPPVACDGAPAMPPSPSEDPGTLDDPALHPAA